MTETAPTNEPVHEADLEWQRAFFERRRMDDAGIPARYRGIRFEPRNAQCRDLVGMALRFVAHFSDTGTERTGLFLTGPPGCGKSHLAAGIATLLAAKKVVQWHNSPDLLARIRDTFDDDAAESEREFIERVCAPDLLVIDDLGAEKVTDFVLDRFYRIVNRRYEACRPIIVTSNYTISQLDARIGPRIVSRICGMCKIVDKFPKEDQRRKD